MVDPVGASRGTFWQAVSANIAPIKAGTRKKTGRRRVNMKPINILVRMKLRGQDLRGQATSESGYSMVVLLVALSIMAVMLTVVMPVWKQAATREKEAELIFRGLQYVHAIALFQRKTANAFPPNVNVLVEQHFLRKKFKDPITNDDFQVIPAGQGVAGGIGSGTVGAAPAGRGSATAPSGAANPGSAAGRGASPIGSTSPIGTPGSVGASAGVGGVTSKSKEKSIRLYNGRGHYNEWAFLYTAPAQAPGAGGAPGAGVPGQRGQPGQQGQPGQSPFGGGIGGRGRPGGPGRPSGPGGPNGPNGPGRGGFGGPGVSPLQPPGPTPRGR